MYYYLKEISQHNKPSDCWLIVHNKVYNVTSMIKKHPGSKNAIIKKCGTDATIDYNFHSSNTKKNIWNKYHIGYVKNNEYIQKCCNIM